MQAKSGGSVTKSGIHLAGVNSHHSTCEKKSHVYYEASTEITK